MMRASVLTPTAGMEDWTCVLRVGLPEGLDLLQDPLTRGAQLLEHAIELGKDDARSSGAGDHDRLFIQSSEDLGGPPGSGSWSMV